MSKRGAATAAPRNASAATRAMGAAHPTSHPPTPPTATATARPGRAPTAAAVTVGLPPQTLWIGRPWVGEGVAELFTPARRHARVPALPTDALAQLAGKSRHAHPPRLQQRLVGTALSSPARGGVGGRGASEASEAAVSSIGGGPFGFSFTSGGDQAHREGPPAILAARQSPRLSQRHASWLGGAVSLRAEGAATTTRNTPREEPGAHSRIKLDLRRSSLPLPGLRASK